MIKTLFLALLAVLAPLAEVPAQVTTNYDSVFKPVKWRSIGPLRGGRSVAASGVVGNDKTYYMGTTGGGLWKTDNMGISWRNISDGFFKTGTIGAIAVAESDPNVVYVGTGEHAIRGVMTHSGDGVYRSTDAGKTWKKVGLDSTRHISRIVVHPKNPDVVLVAAQREAISRYAERRKLIEEYISRINGLFGSISWQPVIYQYRHLGFTELLGCYTACDISLVTPLRDGMNLVAKEFVASRKDERGTLILSEFAGAVNELTTALLVNPNDVYHMKEAMLKAIRFTEAEQRERITHMQQVIRENDVQKWARTFLEDVRRSKSETIWTQPNLMSFDDKTTIFEAYRRARNRLVLLDYDGTLVPFHTRPNEAVPGDVIKELVHRLSVDRKNRVMLISGRDAAALDTWFRGSEIDLVAEHGSMFRPAGSTEWISSEGISVDWKDEVRECVERYVGQIPGSFVEEKRFAIAWHYRAIENIDEEAVKVSLAKELTMLNTSENFDILQGNKVIEIKSKGINKGRFVRSVIETNGYDFVLAIGDDVTDEDMFNALRENHHYTIKVGLATTAARFNLVGVNNVLSFLDQLCTKKQLVRY